MNDISKSENIDTSTINIEDDVQVQYWSERLIVNRSVIKEIVTEVGPSVEEVKKYLKEKSML